MEKKITKKDMFARMGNAISEYLADHSDDKEYGFTEDMVDFIDHELELLAKKSSSKKPTKAQEENEVIKTKIVEVLGGFENGATASEILSADSAFTGMSNQKISALLKQLVEAGTVVKTIDKKKSIFSVA